MIDLRLGDCLEVMKDIPCAKLHISLILENEILKPHNKITLEYYQEVLNEIGKL